jgi:hypothetical protein
MRRWFSLTESEKFINLQIEILSASLTAMRCLNLCVLVPDCVRAGHTHIHTHALRYSRGLFLPAYIQQHFN